MAIDSHMHVNSIMNVDMDDEIKRINDDSKLKSVINIGVNYLSSEEANNIALSNEKFYSAVGIHPLYIEYQGIKKLYDLITDKTVAIGEIGLDNKFDNFDIQREYFISQIIVANELGLPVIIHSNNSNEIIFDIFENVVKPEYGCVFHSFQPIIKDLDYIISHGYYVSFCGRITYPRNERSTEVIKAVPYSSFLVETDAPFFAPEIYKGEVNHSSNVEYVIQRIAQVKNEKYELIEDLSEENTKRLFKRL
jgi:TatD DNase family protein